MGVSDDLRALGIPVVDPVGVARGLDLLEMSSASKARVLREYLRESGQDLTAAVLVAARNYSFYL